MPGALADTVPTKLLPASPSTSAPWPVTTDVALAALDCTVKLTSWGRANAPDSMMPVALAVPELV